MVRPVAHTPAPTSGLEHLTQLFGQLGMLLEGRSDQQLTCIRPTSPTVSMVDWATEHVPCKEVSARSHRVPYARWGSALERGVVE